MEKLAYLIKYLLNENTDVKVENLPSNINDMKNLYRSLCNIREAKPISQEYIKKENEYLKEELKCRGIKNVEDIRTISDSFEKTILKHSTKICLWKGDITTLRIGAIVNAANSQGLGCFVPCHKCIDNQINTFAGVNLRLECNDIMKNKGYNLITGEPIITKGYNLPSNYVIHVVGPIIYDKVTRIEERLLSDCYINCLQLAMKNEIRTIAFPCISTGEFRFPKSIACKIAINTVDSFLEDYGHKFDKIVFNVFNEEDYSIYEKHIK